LNSINKYERGDYEKNSVYVGLFIHIFYPLCHALIMVEQYEEALSAIKRAAELVPEDTDYLFNWGRTLYLLERYSEAGDVLQQVLEIDPENERAQELLEKISQVYEGRSE